ncbi:CHAT domain-containing protein [candidate division KSB1 bacterium]|nr:CHAT domain-containing protein [candidate division KSB1 bacterium]
MYMQDIAHDTFVIIQSDWHVAKARQLIEKLAPTHVIVHRIEQETDYYYLYSRIEALIILGRASNDQTVLEAEAFNLHEYTATPVTDSFANAETARDRTVVLENGRVVGFYDAGAGQIDGPRRGTHRGIPTRDASVPRALVADFPEQVPLNETASLLLSLTAEKLRDAELTLDLPPGSTIDVVVKPIRGFEMSGKCEGSLVISDDKDSLPKQFKLKAIEIGIGKITIYAFHNSNPLGAITLAPEIVPAAQAVRTGRSNREQPLATISVHQPELSLLIWEDKNGTTLTFKLSASNPALDLNLKTYEPVTLRTDAQQYFGEFFKDIEDLPLDNDRDKILAQQRLAAKGSLLFEKVIPKPLQEQLWALKDQIKTVQVQSEEPWIPWELCKLQGEENGDFVEGPFLCEKFSITRWLPEIGFKPELTLNKIALVAPEDSKLPLSKSEQNYIQSLGKGGRKVERIPARTLELLSAMKLGQYDCWHFTGHGNFIHPDPNRAVMVLEEQEQLMPEDLSGVMRNLGKAKPLVFLNACQIGRSAMSLTGIGGWAERFLSAGAAAFIGAYWSVYDQPAHDFARALYSRLVSGVAIGEAIQKARVAIKNTGDPTWLAYTVFADPLATVR